MTKKELYLVDIGILLNENDDEFECYSQVYDSKYGYYDESYYFITKEDLEKAIKQEKTYFKKYYSKNTYVVISYQGFWYVEEDDDLQDLDLSSCDYSKSSVVYSVMKDKHGNIIENFIKGE